MCMFEVYVVIIRDRHPNKQFVRLSSKHLEIVKGLKNILYINEMLLKQYNFWNS